MAIYWFDDVAYTEKAEWLAARKVDWFSRYTTEMVQQVLQVGFAFELQSEFGDRPFVAYSILVHKGKNWLLLQGKGYTCEMHARALLKHLPALREELDRLADLKELESDTWQFEQLTIFDV